MVKSCFLICFLSLSALRAADGDFANSFFAMDTALRDGHQRTAVEQARLLKHLGYDGMGTSGYPDEEFFNAFSSQGLRVFNTYLTLDFDSTRPGVSKDLRELVARLKGRKTDLWIAINRVTRAGSAVRTSSSEGDPIVVPAVRELAELSEHSGIRVALYPHTGQWLERFEDTLRLARLIDRPNVGVTFNLCHWLKVEGERNPQPLLERALPLLMYVTINGAENGNTRLMDWSQLIQPLGSGSYDVAGLLQKLHRLGYNGPIGFQGYGIHGDSADILGRTMSEWRRMTSAVAEQSAP